MIDDRNVKALEAIHGVNWSQLVELEPGLLGLLSQAVAVGFLCRDEWDVEREWSPFKSRIADLVGFHSKHRRHPTLGSYKAYEVVYWKLHNALTGDLLDDD
ncbi:MAG: hypothetical protein U0804_23750 [Gemmataceae bacterium]